MKIEHDVKAASVYRLVPYQMKYYKDDGKLLKQGKSWEVEYTVQFRDVNRYEVYGLLNKDTTITYWLVEHNILEGTGKVGSACKVECIPLYPVELIKEAPDNPEYWIVKRKDWSS